MQHSNIKNNSSNITSIASSPPSDVNTPSITSINTQLDSMSTDDSYRQQQQSQTSNQQEVKVFLTQCGLPQYYDLFIEEGFDRPESLLEITETDLIQMQVKRGHRRLLQRAMANAKGIPSNVPLNITPLLNNDNKDLTAGYTLPTHLSSSHTQTPKSTIQPNEAIDISLQLLPNNVSPITSSASSTNASSSTSSFASSTNTANNNNNHNSNTVTTDPNNMSYTSVSNNSTPTAPNTNNVSVSTPTSYNMYNSDTAAATQRQQPPQPQPQHQQNFSVLQSQSQPQSYFNLNANNSTFANFNDNNMINYSKTVHKHTNSIHAEYFPSAGTMTQQSGGGMSSTEEEAVTSDNVHRLWKRKYHRHAKPDTNAPVKPPSAYVMFSNAVRAELKEQNKSFTDLAKIIGDRWKNISPREKELYETNALRAREEYLKKVEEYQKTDAYKRYQQYISEFKAENEAAARPVGRPRKRSKKEGESSDGNASDSTSKQRPSSKSTQAVTEDHSASQLQAQSQARQQQQQQQQDHRALSVSSSDQRHYPFYLLNEDSQAFQQQEQHANTTADTATPLTINRSPNNMLPPPPHTSSPNN